jgi:hypothetical protein
LPFYAAGWRFRRDRETRFWALAALAGVWLALGITGGLYIVAFYLLPGVNKFNDPARWLLPATFALATLAARGADDALERLPAGHPRFAVAAIVVAITAWDVLRFATTLVPTVDTTVWAMTPPAARALRDGVRRPPRIFHADVDRVWKRFVRHRDYGFDGAPVGETASVAALFGRAGTEPVPAPMALLMRAATSRCADAT